MDLHGVWQHSTLHNIHMDTDMDYGYGLWIYMECGNTPHSIISIWIQTWIMDMEYGSTWSVETLRNIHMDTNMDVDMECIISHMETLHNKHMHTNMDMDTECIISHMLTQHGVDIHMDCQSTWSVETLQ